MLRSPMDDAQEGQLARRMFFGGCACLPLLWVVNSFFFRDKLQAGQLSTETRKWVLLSLAAAGVSTALCLLWFILFQMSWKAWTWAPGVMVSVPDSDMTGW